MKFTGAGRNRDGVWTVVDNRPGPNRLVNAIAWRDREKAEEFAYNLREHYQCSLDSITARYISILDSGAPGDENTIG